MYEIIFNTSLLEYFYKTEFQYKHVDKNYTCSVTVKKQDDRFYREATEPVSIEIKREDAIGTTESYTKYDWPTEVKKYQPSQHLEIIEELLALNKYSKQDIKCLLFLYTDMKMSNYDFISKHILENEKKFIEFSSFYKNDKHFQDYFNNYFLKSEIYPTRSYFGFNFPSSHFLNKNAELKLLFFKTAIRSLDLSGYIENMTKSNPPSLPKHYLDLIDEQLYKDREKIFDTKKYDLKTLIKLLNLYSHSKYYEEYKKTLSKDLEIISKWTKINDPSDFKKHNEFSEIIHIFGNQTYHEKKTFNGKNKFSKEFILNFLADENIDSLKYNAVTENHDYLNLINNLITDKTQCNQVEKIVKILQKNNSKTFFDYQFIYNGANLSKFCGDDFLKKIQLEPVYSRPYFESHCLKKFNKHKCSIHFQDKYWMENYSYCSTSQDCKTYKTDSFLFNSKIPIDEEKYFKKLNLHINNESLTRIGKNAVCLNNTCYNDMDYCNTGQIIKSIREFLSENSDNSKCSTEYDCKIENYSNFFNGRRLDYVDYERKSNYLKRIIDNVKSTFSFCKQQSPEQIKALIKSIEDNNENLKAKCENKKCKGYL